MNKNIFSTLALELPWYPGIVRLRVLIYYAAYKINIQNFWS